MNKNDAVVLFIVLIIIVGTIGIFTSYFEEVDVVGQFFNSRIVNKRIVREETVSYDRKPEPAPPPPAPTPIPEPRLATEETTKKPEFPPEAEYYLRPGKLTNPGPEIKAVKITPISPVLGELKPGRTLEPPEVDKYEFNIIRGILNYVSSFDKFRLDVGCADCWKRDVNDIFINGISFTEPNVPESEWGKKGGSCGSYAILFTTLARLHGIPAKEEFVYFTDWANKQKRQGCWDGTTEGHSYVSVYVDGKWYTVDPTQGRFTTKPIPNAVIWAEGRDFGDFMKYNERYCFEGYRYHAAVSGIRLCNKPRHTPTTNEWALLLACSEPVKTVEWQKKGEK